MRPTEFTTVIMTCNLWKEYLWPEREPALRALFAIRDADVIAVQELSPSTCRVLDQALPRHARVEDDSVGWVRGSNIWWRTDLYRLESYGSEDIGAGKNTRRLFWVRLTPLALGSADPLTVATAHYTWPGDSQELLTGANPRIAQTERTLEALDRLGPRGPCVFVGDLNDDYHPLRILRRAGFVDSFGALGRTSPPTCPVIPLGIGTGDADALPSVPRVIDYQFCRGPIRVRSSEVVEFFLDRTAPSDHNPVVATYTLSSSETTAGR